MLDSPLEVVHRSDERQIGSTTERPPVKIPRDAKVSDIDVCENKRLDIRARYQGHPLVFYIFPKHLSQRRDSSFAAVCSFVGCRTTVWEWVRAPGPRTKECPGRYTDVGFQVSTSQSKKTATNGPFFTHQPGGNNQFRRDPADKHHQLGKRPFKGGVGPSLPAEEQLGDLRLPTGCT
ncbi:unnamed protein product [Xylocopa violacea]|uniref:Uncharacterized protein n=1 Tax=Xylocopa violacea TaxID=135666 RepID=A0ABP1NXD8_XYLVO